MNRKELYERDFEDKKDKHINLKEYDSHILDRIPKEKQRILIVGCGGGELCRVLAHLGHEVTGVDISSEAIDYAKSQDKTYYGITWVCLDIEQVENAYIDYMPMFSRLEREYDIAIISEVLEHLERPFKTLSVLEHISNRIIWTTPWRNRAEDTLHLHWFDYQPIKVDGFGEEPVYELVEFRKNWVKK